MRVALLLGWLWLLPLGATPARLPTPPSGPGTLRLLARNDGPWLPYFTYCFDSEAQPLGGERAAALWAGGRFRRMPPGRVFQAGLTRDRLWLRATVVNTLPQRTRFVWSLYSFVDSAALFVQPGGRGPARFVAGTSGRAVAGARGFPARASCLPFWLEAHAQGVVYLAVENHTGATYLPTDLTTTEDFLAYEQAFFFTKRWTWLLGLYLGSGSAGSAYGAASALITTLLWVYYSGQILLFGAEFTQVYATRYGSRVVPDEHAVKVEVRKVVEGQPA